MLIEKAIKCCHILTNIDLRRRGDAVSGHVGDARVLAGHRRRDAVDDELGARGADVEDHALARLAHVVALVTLDVAVVVLQRTTQHARV